MEFERQGSIPPRSALRPQDVKTPPLPFSAPYFLLMTLDYSALFEFSLLSVLQHFTGHFSPELSSLTYSIDFLNLTQKIQFTYFQLDCHSSYFAREICYS